MHASQKEMCLQVVVFEVKWWYVALVFVVKKWKHLTNIYFSSVLSFENMFTGIKCTKPLVNWDNFLSNEMCVF